MLILCFFGVIKCLLLLMISELMFIKFCEGFIILVIVFNVVVLL